jgi:hypothetical protein
MTCSGQILLDAVQSITHPSDEKSMPDFRSWPLALIRLWQAVLAVFM